MPKRLNDTIREDIGRLEDKKVKLEQELAVIIKKLKLLEDTVYTLDQYNAEEAEHASQN